MGRAIELDHRNEGVVTTGLWLRTTPDRLQVLVEINGLWRVINDIAMPKDGDVISCISEPSSLMAAPIDAVAHP